MPNWIPITKPTLYEAKVAALIDACDNAALGEDQEPRSPGIIQGVVNEVRNSVARHHRVDADETTIPKGLRNLAVDLIIAGLKKAIEQGLTEDEVRDVSARRQTLRDIEKGEGPAIDEPDDAVTPEVDNSGSVKLIREPRDNPFGGLV